MPNRAQLWRLCTRGGVRRAKFGTTLLTFPLSPRQNDDSVRDPVDTLEVFDLIRDIKDPEHEDLSLEALNVLQVRARCCALAGAHSNESFSSFWLATVLSAAQDMLNWSQLGARGREIPLAMVQRLS